MKVIRDYPPNIEKIREVFNPPINAVFTYGDTLYAPMEGEIDPSLMAHEETHAKQQTDPEKWWNRYFTDSEFRLSQELEAYRVQYEYYCSRVKNRELRSRFLMQIAKDLSSPMYGTIISLTEAVHKIR